MEKSLNGQEYDGFDAIWDVGTGAGASYIPDANQLFKGSQTKADIAGMLGLGQVLDWAGEGLHLGYDRMLGK